MFYYSKERNGKDFSEMNIRNFRKSYIAISFGKKSVTESAFNKIAAIHLTLLRRNFHQERFPVNTSEFLALLQKDLTRTS